MKKLLIVLLMLSMCGCQKSNSRKLADLGYNKDDIAIIVTLSEDTQELFLNEYNDTYVMLINTDDFKEENLDKYAKYFDYFDTKTLVRLINKDVLNDKNIDTLLKIEMNENFKVVNEDAYLKYQDKFEANKLIQLVNNDAINDKNIDKLIELYNNKFYVERLEDLYLKYLDEYDNVRDCIEIVNTNRYEPLYTDIKETDTSKNYLMLINKYHKLSSDYEPDDLVSIASDYGWGETREATYEAFVQMADDASEAGYDIRVCSAYRSYSYQDALYNKYLARDEGGQESVDTYSARPGHSEHQSGLCLDMETTGYSMDDFGLSEASAWVNENCYKYGFIIRYTGDKQNITGYEEEAWQVRYVGSSEVAKFIKDNNITFDEYYTVFVENE